MSFGTYVGLYGIGLFNFVAAVTHPDLVHLLFGFWHSYIFNKKEKSYLVCCGILDIINDLFMGPNMWLTISINIFINVVDANVLSAILYAPHVSMNLLYIGCTLPGPK